MIDKIKAYFEGKLDNLYSSIALHITERTNILQTEIGDVSKKVSEQNELFDKIVKLQENLAELERENRLLEETAEDAQEELKNTTEILQKKEQELVALNDLNVDLTNKIDVSTNQATDFLEKLAIRNADVSRLEGINMLQEAKNKQLERDVEDTEKALKDATERDTEALAKRERLLQLVKEYDKATVSMLNAILERKGSIEERAAWEKAKEALKKWDSPIVKRKPGRPKKQS